MFFSLLASMIANIAELDKDIAILGYGLAQIDIILFSSWKHLFW